MKVKLFTGYAGPKGTFPPGSVLDFTPEEAEGLVATRQGILVDDDSEPPKKEAVIEQAVAPGTPETAAVRTRRGGRNEVSKS